MTKKRLSKKEVEARKLIINEIEKSLKALEGFFVKYCKDNQTKAVNIEVIKAAHKTWLVGMKEGIGYTDV